MQIKENELEVISNELSRIDSDGLKYYNSLPQNIQNKILEILSDYDAKKFNSLTDKIYGEYFYTTPPSIRDFLEDPYFFGKLTSGMFPKWKENLIDKVFNPSKNFNEIILTGAIGGGKSYFMRVVHAYLTTKLLCMKDPNKLFGISDGDNIVIGFFNVTLKKAKSDQYNQFEQLLLRSPFIAEKVNSRNSEFKRVNPDMPFKNSTLMYALGSSAVHALGQNTISGQLDEANFSSRRKLNSGEIERSIETYQTIKSRISSRFEAKIRIFYHFFIMIIASSKTFGNSFVNSHIDKVKNNDNVIIFDYSEWDVKPPETYELDENGKIKTFKILVGDKRIKSRILDNSDDLIPENCRVIDAPVSLKQYAEYDLNEFLRSRAGINTYQEHKFIPRDDLVVKAFKSSAHKNGFISDSVECALGNTTPLSSYINIDEIAVKTFYGYIPRVNPNQQRFIHIDLSKNHDFTGFCMGHFDGYVDSVLEKNRKNPKIYIDLACRFEYLHSEIDYERIRNLIFYLNDVLNFRIKEGQITFDQYQSTDSLQLLMKQNYKATRVRIIPDMYYALKSSILGEYIDCVGNEILLKEVLNLEKDSQDIIQKPLYNIDGTNGTDDISDSLAVVSYQIITNYSASSIYNESIPNIVSKTSELINYYRGSNLQIITDKLIIQNGNDYEPV